MPQTKAYAAHKPKAPLAPFSFNRRVPGPADVVIEIKYCGVCHSDIHQVRDEWAAGVFPMVPGHEIVGKVTAVGKDVTRFKVGDLAGVGCMVDSCRACANCKAGEEQYCQKQVVFTYNSKDHAGEPTYGGYSGSIVVTESFALKISPKLDLAATAPLLCAGITTYSPMKHWKVGKGSRMGVVGLGGLGHMALKFGKAFGAHVVQFTTSPGKEEDARRLGATEVVLSKDENAMKKLAGSLDFIIDTVSAPHDLNAYLGLLKLNGTMVQVGAPDKPSPVHAFSLLGNRRSLAGSMIGGIAETQEMLDYCAHRGIVCDIEKINIQVINEAYERMLKNDVKYRFVIDMASLK